MTQRLQTTRTARIASRRALRRRSEQKKGRLGLEQLEERCLLNGDMTPPQIIGVEAFGDARGKQIATVVLTASEDMAGAAAEMGRNYSVRLPGKDKRLGTGDDMPATPAAADYDPGKRRSTLTIARPLKLGSLFQVTASPDYSIERAIGEPPSASKEL